MAEHRFEFEKGLIDGEAHREVVKLNLPGMISAFRYNPVSGICNVTTRPFPPFGKIDPESEASKLVNELIASTQKQADQLKEDRGELDKRRESIIAAEKGIERSKAEFEKEVKERSDALDKRKAELDKREKELDDRENPPTDPPPREGGIVSRMMRGLRGG